MLVPTKEVSLLLDMPDDTECMPRKEMRAQNLDNYLHVTKRAYVTLALNKQSAARPASVPYVVRLFPVCSVNKLSLQRAF